MSHSIALVIRRDRPDRLGRCPIMLRITINRKSTYKSTGFKVLPEEWDDGMLSRRVPNHSLINTSLSQLINATEKAILQRQITGHSITIDVMQQELRSDGRIDFLSYAEAVLEKERHLNKKSTNDKNRSEINKIRAYQARILFADIDEIWLMKFDQYMAEELGNGQNTRWRTFKFLKKIFNAAITAKLVREYPFKLYTVKRKKTLRTFLTLGELKRLEEVIWSCKEESLQLCGLYFLLSCWAGLRISDLRKVSEGKMVQGSRLILAALKNEEVISIKINEKIKPILDAINGRPMLADQTYNIYIKILVARAGIDKDISFHKGRHTFATICADLGIPKEIVQRLLGHEDLRSTGIYYAITDPALDRAMDKFNQL